MLRNDEDAVELVHLCLEKSGFNRNYRPILEAIEEVIFGNAGAINQEEFECVDDYKYIRYRGKVSSSLDILTNGVVNRSIEHDFTQPEIAFLNAMSVDGVFRVYTKRMDGATHDFHFQIAVPTSLINLMSEKIVLNVKLNQMLWGECKYEVQAKQIGDSCSSERLKMLTTLIALS